MQSSAASISYPADFFVFLTGKFIFLSSNPFATSKNHILTDLYESDDDKGEYDDLDLEANKIDEKGEGDILEEEDDEPDPEWGDEEIDVKKEGYFDETGAYKLKQP